MAVALLLVIVVMREAGKPAMYETFFGDPHGNWTPVGEQKLISEKASGGGETKQDETSSEQVAATPQLSEAMERLPKSASPDAPFSDASFSGAPCWVKELTVPLQKSWIKTLVMLEAGTAEASKVIATEDLSASRLALGQCDSPRRTSVEDAINQIEEFSVGDESVVPSDLSWEKIRWWAEPMLDALDQAALTRVADGTFWTGRDSDSFYMQLARAHTLSTDVGVTAGTLQLLQQPQVYQGQPLRLVGTLGLAENIAAQNTGTDFGIDDYWKVWMIPSDGGIRPILLICHELPSELSSHLDVDGKWDRRSSRDNPQGEFAAVGRFIKRLPYRSSAGADLAPVVIGRVVASRGTEAASSKTSQKNARSMSNKAKWWGLIGAMIGGVAIAGGLMYRTSADAKRSRRLRSGPADLPESSLSDLQSLPFPSQPSGTSDSNSETEDESV